MLLVMLAEAGWLMWRGEWRFAEIMLRLSPGALMLIALRAALVGLAWWWIALALALSFPFHLADLRRGPPRR